MTQFVGFLRAGRGEIKRCSYKKTGIGAEVRSWTIGATVSLCTEPKNNVDYGTFTLQRGSGHTNPFPIFIVAFDESGAISIRVGDRKYVVDDNELREVTL